MSEVPHPIPFRTRSLSPPEPMVLRLKARESRSPPGLPDGYMIVCLPYRASRDLRAGLSNRSSLALPFAAGWSSPVARQAHNLKVAGSNPAPAPIITPRVERLGGFALSGPDRRSPAGRRNNAVSPPFAPSTDRRNGTKVFSHAIACKEGGQAPKILASGVGFSAFERLKD